MIYKEFGEHNPDTMIFLHGGGLSWWNYKDEIELLKKDFHLIIPVLDGHADSDRDFCSIENNASEIVQFIDEHCNGKVKLIAGLTCCRYPRAKKGHLRIRRRGKCLGSAHENDL